MKRKFTLLIAALALLTMMATTGKMWGQAAVNTTLWEETWTGGDANETPSAYGFEGTTVYGNATLTYAQSSTNTKLYAQALAGGTSPELLLSKSNQTWTISNIPTGQATEMSLTFLSNKATFDVTSTTTGITISGSEKSWTISANNVTSFNLTIKNTGSSNARIDNILLKVTTAGGGSDPTITLSDSGTGNIGNYAVNTEITRDFTVTQSNLTAPISLSATNGGTFTINNETITSIPAGDGSTVVKWHFTPTATGQFTSVITATSGETSATCTYLGYAYANHNVIIAEMEHGTVIADPTSTFYWELVTLTITPDEGYELDELMVVDADNNPVTLTNNSFHMPDSDATVSATFVESSGSTVIDELTNSNTINQTTSSYTSWTAIGTSGAEYAGQSAGGNGTIQLRTTNNNSGIVSTSSAGKVKKVIVDWYSGTYTGRTLNIYGSNTAYESPTELYDSSTQGTLLGTIVCGTSTELTISDDYEFIGMRSNSGAMYINEIDITWETSGTPSPSFTISNNDEIAYDATSGSFNFTVNNPVDGGTTTVSENVDWISNAAVSGNSVSFTTTANEAGQAREGVVTLTYTYGDNQTVNKDVTVSQAGNPNVINNISSITASGTFYRVKGTVVAKGAYAFVLGDGTGYIYYYNGYVAPAVNIGEKKVIEGTTGNYGNVIQFTNSATISASETSNYDGTPEVTVITEVPDYSTGLHLSTYLQFEGQLTKTGNYYYVSVGSSTINIVNPSTDQATTLTNLLNKNVRVKGFFAGNSNSAQAFTVLMESVEEIVPTEPTITVADATVNVIAEGAEGTLTVTYENITTVVAEVKFYEQDGETETTYDWLDAEINTDNNVDYIIDANDGTARTAYLKVYALDDNSQDVYSNLVTINQDEYVAPTYAELPFEFNGGRADIENTDGLYQEGLGSDYNNSPKLKFDGTGDWLLLQFQERPGTLTFDIKGNSYSSGSTSTFKVQTSADGTTYTDLVTYTELGDTQNESFDNLDENVRYIKWIYTEKGATSGGNVGLGNIALAEYVEPVASITVTPNLVEATIEETEGYLGITYVALDITQADDFGIQFYDVNNQELNGDDEPDWIQAAPATQSGEEGYFVYYIIEENSGAERTAYFKVWALEDTEPVYSNLVTISQAAPVVLPPVINAEDIEIEFDATSGEIAYTITNPTTATLSANSTDEWITDITIEAEKVSFSTTVNEGDTDRIGTITLSYEGAEDKVVTVTQGHQVVDYAILPFEWEGGTTAAFNALTGASTYGVGDYAESHGVYRMKLDSDGDYIQVKTDSQPGKVTIGVKMIGGVNTSYITVKASTDGQEFDDGEALEISGTSGSILTLETTRSFDADVRFVKMVFAKGSNVGVGPITITKFTTDPVIVAEDKEIACDATAGEIVYSITNPVDGGVLTANTTAEWLTIGTVGETVPFTCEANTEATAREATVTLTYTYGDSQTVTKDVTVTQAAYIIDYAEMPFDFDGGRADIENTNGLTQSGLDTDYGSSPKLKFKNQGTTVTLKLNAAPVSLSYDIKGNSFSGGQFDVEYSADGETYTNLVSYTELGNTQYVLHTDFDSNVRYIRWIYTTKVNGNVALGNIHATEHYDTYGDVTFNDLDLTATSESLIVHTSSVVTITGTLTNTSSDNLIIEDGGQLVFSGTGVQATMKKSTAHAGAKDVATDWYTIASPLAADVATDAVGNLTNGTYDLYRYNEAAVMWENAKDTEHSGGFNELTVGRGYLYWNGSGSDITFAGELRNTDVAYTLKADGAGNYKGFNLIGNPFSQNITMSNITGVTLSGGYVLTQAGGWGASIDEIAPCQGFLVQVEAETDITITKPTSSGKSRANRDYLAFTVANSEYEDVAYAMFEEATGLSKINHRNADIPMLYIPQNDKNYAIATMDDNTQAFNLNFKAMTTGQYTLSYKAEGKYSYLHVIDRLTGEDIDMLLDGEYSFIGSPRDNEARFIVKLSYNANINEVEVNDNFAYQNGSDIIVNGNGELQVFDVTGRMVMNTKINGIQTVNVPATGMYIFRMVGESVQTQKIVVR